MTITITAVCVGIGGILGLVACVGRLSDGALANRASMWFIDFFRTVPEMILIFWAYQCLPLLLDVRISALGCGIIALSLVTGANMGEIFRAGVMAVPRGQVEAARALAISEWPIWWKVIIPQAIRRMMPAFITYLTELLKQTALLMAIGVTEMAFYATTLGQETFRFMEFLTAIAVLYFVIIFPLSMYARYFEQRLRSRTGQ